MPAQKPSRLLSIFLIKPEITAPQDIFKEVAKLDLRNIQVRGQRVGDLYARRSTVRTPRWVSLFRQVIEDINSLGLKSASAAAVLLVQRGQRTLAVAFGQGRHLLKTSALEENFGLYASLNSVDPGRIRSIDRKRFDAISRLTREQAIREVPIVNFGLELEQDMLRGVTGRPVDEALGKRVSGRDSLCVAVPVELGDLNSLLDRYVAKSQETTFRDKIPGVGNIEEVREVSQRDMLDSRLLQKIRERDFDHLWLAVPDLLEWTDIGGFTYSGAENAELNNDIDLQTYLDRLNNPGALGIPMLKRHKVTCLSESTDNIINTWSVYRCIYAELDSNDGTFILENGKWQRLDRDLVSDVDREIMKIPNTTVRLPPYMHLEDEEDYNIRFVATDSRKYALMDRKDIIYGGGRSKVEFCDVFTRNGIMVHVKRYTGSAVLSHLFAQGITPATALLWDESFRRALNRKLPSTHKLPNTAQRPSPDKYEVAYAIASKETGAFTLPFFSRLTLRNVYRQLVSYGFHVTCTKIDMAPRD